ncbi:hypothetical protein BN1723_014241, partial [Verticillium longisporum]
MLLQGPGSSIALVAVIGGEQIDIRTASQRVPIPALREEFVKALAFITLQEPDLTLLRLQHHFRRSLISPRKKTPDRLTSVIARCSEGTIDGETWEARIYKSGQKYFVDAFRDALGHVDWDEAVEINFRHLQDRLMEKGGQHAVTALHYVSIPTNAVEAQRAEAQFSNYGGILCLAACAVAAVDDGKVTTLLQGLPDSHEEHLVAAISSTQLHMDLTNIIRTLFTTKQQPSTKQDRIGSAPRKSQRPRAGVRSQKTRSRPESDPIAAAKSRPGGFNSTEPRHSDRPCVDSRCADGTEARLDMAANVPASASSIIISSFQTIADPDNLVGDWAWSALIPGYDPSLSHPAITDPPLEAETGYSALY